MVERRTSVNVASLIQMARICNRNLLKCKRTLGKMSHAAGYWRGQRDARVWDARLLQGTQSAANRNYIQQKAAKKVMEEVSHA